MAEGMETRVYCRLILGLEGQTKEIVIAYQKKRYRYKWYKKNTITKIMQDINIVNYALMHTLIM